jgi:hypothetical protein
VISGVDDDYDLKRRSSLIKNTVNCRPYGGTIDCGYDNRDAQTFHYSDLTPLRHQALAGRGSFLKCPGGIYPDIPVRVRKIGPQV